MGGGEGGWEAKEVEGQGGRGGEVGRGGEGGMAGRGGGLRGGRGREGGREGGGGGDGREGGLGPIFLATRICVPNLVAVRRSYQKKRGGGTDRQRKLQLHIVNCLEYTGIFFFITTRTNPV